VKTIIYTVNNSAPALPNFSDESLGDTK